MEEQTSEKVAEENSTIESEEMECDEAVSVDDLLSITIESSNETHEHETSQMQSETTGVETSTDSTSTSELPGEEAESLNKTVTKKDALVHEQTKTEMVISASELSREIADLDANERTKPSSIEAELEQLSAENIQSEESSSADAVKSLPQESQSIIASDLSKSVVSSEQDDSNTKVKGKHTSISPKAFFDKVRSFSHTKKLKRRSRSKSISPSEKSRCKVEESNPAPEAHIPLEGKEYLENESDEATLSPKKTDGCFKFLHRDKSKASHTKRKCLRGNDEEIEKQSTSKKERPVKKESTTDVPMSRRIRDRYGWSNRDVEIEFPGGTSSTDVPSTSSSEVFSIGSPGKPSAAKGNPEKAVEGDYFYNKQTSNTTNDNETGNRDQINDPTNEQSRQEAATAVNTDEQEPTSNENVRNDDEKNEETDK